MRPKVTARLSEEFRIAIPDAIVKGRHWRAGQEFAFIPKGDGVLLVPVPRKDDLAGIARGADGSNYRDRNDSV